MDSGPYHKGTTVFSFRFEARPERVRLWAVYLGKASYTDLFIVTFRTNWFSGFSSRSLKSKLTFPRIWTAGHRSFRCERLPKQTCVKKAFSAILQDWNVNHDGAIAIMDKVLRYVSHRLCGEEKCSNLEISLWILRDFLEIFSNFKGFPIVFLLRLE